MDYEEYKRKALGPIVNYIESAMALYSKEELYARIKKALQERESEDERIRKALYEFISDTLGDEFDGYDFNKREALAYLEKQKDEVQRQFNLGVQAGKEEVMYEVEKEQKPNVELIQKSWYMEGYHDGKYNNEPKWLIQTGKGGPRYEENPKYETQKPAEWSEEDKSKLSTLLGMLTVMRKLNSNDIIVGINSKKDREKMFNEIESWLKSLRPQSKQKRHLDMKDQWCCNAAWAAVRDSDAYNGEEKQFILDFLQRCEPQPHWKPSEEQMEALNKVVNGEVLLTTQHKSLESLLDYLEKL